VVVFLQLSFYRATQKGPAVCRASFRVQS